MPSVGESPLQPSAPTLFIDRNSGGRTFRDLVVKAGIEVILHDEQFPQTMADEDWLGIVGNSGWLVVTGDNDTTRSPLFLQRLANSKAFVFVLLGLNGASREGKADCISKAYPTMRNLSQSEAAPFLWRIGKDDVSRPFDFRRVLARMHRSRRI